MVRLTEVVRATLIAITGPATAKAATRVGHHDRQGGGENPNSWNSAHNSRGCSQENLQATGGNGFYYCFGSPDEQSDLEPKLPRE